MVKLFIGNLNENSDADALRKLFEQYGTVSECDILNRFGFVHMDDDSAAQQAIENLHHYMFDGKQINVELSTGTSTKRGGGRGGRDRGGRGRGRDDRRDRGRGDRYGRDRYDPYPPPPRGGPYDPYYDDPYDRRPLDPYDRRPLPPRDPYRDPYYDRDPYARYPPPDRDPYARYPPPDRDPYMRHRDPYGRLPPPRYEADPYARPPPEYYYDHPRVPAERYPYDPYYDGPPSRRPEDYAARTPYADTAEADAYAQPRKPEYEQPDGGYNGAYDAEHADRGYPQGPPDRGVGHPPRRGAPGGMPTNGRTAAPPGQKAPQNNLYMSFE